MPRSFKGREDGTSLIELMVGLAILSVIALAASDFFKRVGTSDYEAHAKAKVTSQITLYLNAVERDLKLRDTTKGLPEDLCTSSICKKFTVTRRIVSSAGPDDLMKVSYTTSCKSLPPAIMTVFKKKGMKFDASSVKTAMGKDASGAENAGKCIITANCPEGQYPQMEITYGLSKAGVAPTTKISYPPKFPDLKDDQSAAAGIIGGAICGQSSGGGGNSSDRVIVEGAIMTAEGKVRVEKREISMPKKNIANIQMLPTQ